MQTGKWAAQVRDRVWPKMFFKICCQCWYGNSRKGVSSCWKMGLDYMACLKQIPTRTLLPSGRSSLGSPSPVSCTHQQFSDERVEHKIYQVKHRDSPHSNQSNRERLNLLKVVNSTKKGLGKGALSEEEIRLLTLRMTTNIFRCPSVRETVPLALLSQAFPWWENAILKAFHSCSICSGAEWRKQSVCSLGGIITKQQMARSQYLLNCKPVAFYKHQKWEHYYKIW